MVAQQVLVLFAQVRILVVQQLVIENPREIYSRGFSIVVDIGIICMDNLMGSVNSSP